MRKFAVWDSFALGGFLAGSCSGRNLFKNTCIRKKSAATSITWVSPASPEDPVAGKHGNETKVSEIAKYGHPSEGNVRQFKEFVLSYDTRLRIPKWILELLTSESIEPGKNVDRVDSTFIPDETIHEYFRAQNSDYSKSGYDRGHMAAAGNHKSTQEVMDETFHLSNMAPQVGVGFNRGQWRNLEIYVRDLTDQYEKVYCCTGPLFLSHKERNKRYVEYEVIGANEVAVPTHFFKVVICENDDGKFEMEAFVLPNEELDSDEDLNAFRVAPGVIKKAAGLLFYDKLPDNKLVKINGKKN